MLKYLQINARIDKSEVEYTEIVTFISNLGTSEDTAISLLNKLQTFNVINTNEKHLSNPKYFITLCGGYYISNLCKMFVYVETVMYDTNILDSELFNKLCEITYLIEDTRDWSERMVLRKERIKLFFDYLKILENQLSKEVELKEYLIIDEIFKNVSDEVDGAIKRLEARSRGNV